LDATLAGDPAATNRQEILLSYPGFYAIFVYRLAHALYELQVPVLPRMMTEYAHNTTGVDIHPGAQIGAYFFIDHGTGVVIGQTTVIGQHVKMYQSATLGALSPGTPRGEVNGKRHPTVEDNVTIYAGATILGGGTVIGQNAVIGGNVFVTESVVPDARVNIKLPELEIRMRRKPHAAE
jgi:serine O-acetyltransferase